jgi:predicted small lipoprotein YifL
MSGVSQILVSPSGPRRAWLLVAALLLSACGQKGPLYLPSGNAAAGRASLPETLAPSTAVRPAQAASGPGAATPPSGIAAPVRNP